MIIGAQGFPRVPVTSAAMNIIAHGNSLTAGEGSTGGEARWTNVAAAILGVPILNQGVGGQSIQAMKVSAPTVVDPNLVSGKLNVLVAWEFTNEVSTNGRDGTAAHTQWASYCTARRAAAAAAGKQLHIISVGLLPAAAGTTTAITNARMAAMIVADNLLRDNYRTYSDQHIDLAAVEPFKSIYAGGDWSVTAFNNTGMYNRFGDGDGTPNDRVHLGNSGYLLVGQTIAQALRRVRKK